MIDEFDSEAEELELGQFAAVELVEHGRRMRAFEMELRVMDDSGMWLVSVQRIGASGSGKHTQYDTTSQHDKCSEIHRTSSSSNCGD